MKTALLALAVCLCAASARAAARVRDKDKNKEQKPAPTAPAADRPDARPAEGNQNRGVAQAGGGGDTSERGAQAAGRKGGQRVRGVKSTLGPRGRN